MSMSVISLEPVAAKIPRQPLETLTRQICDSRDPSESGQNCLDLILSLLLQSLRRETPGIGPELKFCTGSVDLIEDWAASLRSQHGLSISISDMLVASTPYGLASILRAQIITNP
jgi:hypothetical protein